METTSNAQGSRRRKPNNRKTTRSTPKKEEIKVKLEKPSRSFNRNARRGGGSRNNARRNIAQQRLAKTVKSRINSKLANVLSAITLPFDSAPVRVPAASNTAETAIAKPYVDEELNFADQGVGQDTMAIGSQLIILRRQLTTAMIRYFGNQTNPQNTQYQFLLDDQGYHGTTEEDPPNTSAFIDLIYSGIGIFADEFQIGLVYAAAQLPFQPHGGNWYPLTFKEIPEERYYWIDKGAIVTINYTLPDTPSGFGAAGAAIKVYSNGDKRSLNRTVVLPINMTNNNITVLDGTQISGYYTFTAALALEPPIVPGTPTNARRRQIFQDRLPGDDAYFRLTINSLLYTTTGQIEIWGHQALPGFDANYLAVEEYRVNALGALLSCTTPQLAAGGNVAIRQIPKSKPWWELIPGSPYKNVATGSSHRSNGLELGIYGWYKPADILDFHFEDEFTCDNGTLYDVFAPAIPDSDYIAIAIDGTGLNFNATGISPSNALIFKENYCWHIEYRTEDIWRESKVSYLNKDVFAEAEEALRGISQFSENPTHWKDIWNGIKTGISKVPDLITKYAPLVSGVASALSKLII